MIRLVALALALVLAACPAASAPVEPDPVAALAAYRDALVQGHPRDAFQWIHPEAREGLDERGFETLYQRHREALVAQADALLRLARSRQPAQRARVTTAKGDAVLEKGPEGWRLLAPVGQLGARP